MKEAVATKAMVFPVLLALGGLFGAAFLFMKVLVEEIAPAEIVYLPEESHRDLWCNPKYYRVFSLVNGGPGKEADLFAGLR